MTDGQNQILSHAERKFLKHRFTLLCHRLMEFNESPSNDAQITKWWELLDQHYSDIERYYHNWRHIMDCLREFDKTAHDFEAPLAAEIAFWFHDMINVIPPNQMTSNETLNARQSAMFLLDFKTGSNKLIRLVGDAILTTDHDPDRPAGSLSHDQKLLCSIDLAILGQPWDRYVEYAQGIHLENRLIGFEIYCQCRGDFLKRFLKRENIFPSSAYRSIYEEEAIRNISREILCLSASSIPTADAS